MIYLLEDPPETFTPPTIAIHIHLFYADLAEEFCGYLQHMPFPYALFVSVMTPADADTAKIAFKSLIRCEHFQVKVVENRGRDMASFFCTFGDEMMRYDIAGHFHTKKSLYAPQVGTQWRQYLLNGLLGSVSTVTRIMALFLRNPALGMVYPQTFYTVPCWGHHVLANRVRMNALSERMGIPVPDDEMFDFCAGTMFWVRTAAVRPLLHLGLQWEDFEEEKGQMDGALAHALERMIGYAVSQGGYSHGVLRMPDNPQKLRWGLDQYPDVDRRLSDMLAMLPVRLVVMDIFDTLLVRPLRHAEDIKKLTAHGLSSQDAEVYRAFRVRAEAEARVRYQKDVSVDEIFAVLADLAGISPEQAKALQEVETRMEMQSVSAHGPALALLEKVRKHGLRVVYASDMFLKRETLMAMLHAAGVPEPDHLYLSHELNKRKDRGEMQPYILSVEGVKPEEALMIGDNLRSDIQIAADMKMLTIPILHMADMLKSSPRTLRLGRASFSSVQDSLTIGLVFRHMRQKARPLDVFSPFGFFQDFYGIGYSLLGPVLTGFSAWLVHKAKEKGIKTFYFLARDGKILRHTYETFRAHTGEGPPSVYLEVSRRAVSVPAIETFEDLMDILRMDFKGTSVQMLFAERLGIDLSEKDIRDLKARKKWPDFSAPGDWSGKIEEVRVAAEVLWPRIAAHAQKERTCALSYLRLMKLMEDQPIGLVDVGYMGTIQHHIARLLNRPLEGFYLLTGKTTTHKDIAHTHADTFGYIGEACSPLDPFIVHSFKMERLLSADEGQVVCYQKTDTGEIAVCRREFSDPERGCNPAREELRAGLDAFIRDACRIRDTLYPDFEPAHSVAAAMWLCLEELDVLTDALLLDDFYSSGALV